MASKNNTHILIIIMISASFLVPSFLCVVTSGKSQETEEEDLRKWISWNLHHHKIKKNNHSTSSSMEMQIAETNKKIIVVSQDGAGDFVTIGDAIDSIPLLNTRRVIFDIKPGVYREKIMIGKHKGFVTLKGDASNPPTITGNDTAFIAGNTLRSATVAVDSDYFIAINIIFQNTAPHVVGVGREQGVALRISGTKAAFYNCSFYGSQDTLYDHKGVHYFNNCFIQGSVDFIFGYARSFYENCVLNSVAKNVGSSITAQKRSMSSSMSSGFSFKNCSITGSGHVYLGRAWGDYSRVVFSYTYMDNIILPQGWSDWGKTSRDKKVYYGEYKCSGPGANVEGRVSWAHLLTDEYVIPFLGTYFIDGDTWLIDPFANYY